MTIWCEVDRCYYECESVWNGRDPLPGLGAIERRASYLVQSASTGADTLSGKPQRRRECLCACGRKMRVTLDSEVRECGICRGADRHVDKLRLCRGCEQWKTWGDPAKHSWCNDCKAKRGGRRARAEEAA